MIRLLSLLLVLSACDDKAGTPSEDEGGLSTDTGDDTGSAETDPDADGDGFDEDVDCDDDDASIFPGADEVCNGVDDDCDGDVDVDDDDVADVGVWYTDADGDGHGDPGSPIRACSPPEGAVELDSDCDDDDDAVNPEASEVCNGIDDDCDGEADGSGATDAILYYIDYDGDGYGSDRYTELACTAPEGFVDNALDCDDTEATRSPVGTETCNGEDDDCDGSIDEEATDPSTFYTDTDADGYGDPDSTTSGCTAPTGYVDNALDCDDSRAASSPAGTEACNEEDDDCDGTVDEADAIDAGTWYLDADNDGYGAGTSTSIACDQPSGHVADDSDCDDADATVNPGVTSDSCDGIDSDCDTAVDEDGAYGEDATCPGLSCEDILATASSTDGVYWIDPDGSGAYEVWCEMGTSSGGWTLLAVYTNGDGAINWDSYDTNWVTATTFGDPTDPTLNADAKSEAFNSLDIDELLITDASGTVYVQSGTTCVGGNPALSIFQRNSSNASSCAYSCSTVSTSSPWNQSYTDSTLRFRCMDTDGTTTANGYTVATDDNSMITTLSNGSYMHNNFGLGAGYGTSSVDYDYSTDDYPNAGYTGQVLLYGR